MDEKTLRLRHGVVSAKSPNDFFNQMLYAGVQIKIFHLQSNGFIHTYLGELYDNLNEELDKLIECYQYRGDIIKDYTFFNTDFTNYTTKENIIDYLYKRLNYLYNSKKLFESDEATLIDNMTLELKRTIYKFIKL
jgi:hypothetical protein